jgi:anti-sigma B factor antagonist
VPDPFPVHESRLTVELGAPDATGAVTVRLAGELDLQTADRLRGELAALEADTCAVQLDCSGVEFLDSSGIRAILAARLELDERPLVITSASPVVERLLDITGLRELLVPA